MQTYEAGELIVTCFDADESVINTMRDFIKRNNWSWEDVRFTAQGEYTSITAKRTITRTQDLINE